jgi:protein-L-isoaspartate(D-aspartate) O-methyltransferase
MVAEIETIAARVSGDGDHGRISARVLEALREVPREAFVPEERAPFAYEDRPLSIGYRQTISQPYIVALMTELAAPGPDDRVLEIGTGSGYQSAILARLARHVYTIEIVEALGRSAAEVFRRLGITNISSRIGDGFAGWPEEASFDAIVVTAAPAEIPPALTVQLRPGGRLVIPVGSVHQELLRVEKGSDGALRRSSVLPVRFVPLTRG